MRIAICALASWHHTMPGIIFWLLAISAMLFFKLTTPDKRRSMIETY